MSHSSFDPPPSAATLLPSGVPLLTQIDRESPTEWRVRYTYDSGLEVTALVTIAQDGAEGDAPDAVLAAVDRKFDVSDSYDDSYEPDDGYRYASESHYEGGRL